MPTTHAESQESTDLKERTVRALTEYMTVLPLGGDVYSVTTESGAEYRVDACQERCTCSDHAYRGVECKHIQRVVFATGHRPIPGQVDTNEIDAQLGDHVTGSPRVAATDGGATIESFSSTKDSSATDDEGCWCDDHDFPCFDCYRVGRRDLPGDAE